MDDASWLKEAIEKIDSKVDKLDDKLSDQGVILAEQKVVLAEHQRRSLANEENVQMLREEFKPVEKHVQIVNGVFKIIGFLATVSGAVIAVVKFFFS